MDLCNIGTVRGLLERHGFHFSKAMGQNFLIAGWVPERIATESKLDTSTGVLEIGPGIGCLTARLSAYAGKVVAVELDKRLPAVLAESLAGCENVEIISGDILSMNIPALVDARLAGLRPVVCANLPYNITTPVLTALIEAKRFTSINVMIQREVARRLCAVPATPEYGAFTVYVNYYTRPQILFDVAPGCFMPQPKVTSSVIRLEPRTAPPVLLSDEKLFFRVVRAAFAQRRKTLVNALTAEFGRTLQKAEITELLLDAGFDPRIRGEVLDILGFGKIAERIGERFHAD